MSEEQPYLQPCSNRAEFAVSLHKKAPTAKRSGSLQLCAATEGPLLTAYGVVVHCNRKQMLEDKAVNISTVLPRQDALCLQFTTP